MDTALRRQPWKTAGGGGSGKAMPLAGALDINYTCWNSRPTFCFQMRSQYNHREERGKRKEAEACKQETECLSCKNKEKGLGAFSGFCPPINHMCKTRSQGHNYLEWYPRHHLGAERDNLEIVWGWSAHEVVLQKWNVFFCIWRDLEYTLFSLYRLNTFKKYFLGHVLIFFFLML